MPRAGGASSKRRRTLRGLCAFVSVSEYWIARLKRAMTAEGSQLVALSSRGRAENVSAQSQPQYLLSIVEVGQQRLGRSVMEHGAALESEDAVGQRQHQVEIVLDDDD